MTSQTTSDRDPAGSASSGATGGSSPASQRRTDIQGLRAIAVLAVVAVHVGISSVTGGFVGVDVFFAISGFLITEQLLRSAERDTRVSLLGFYARRARRILPAATFVLIVTCAYAAWQLGFVRTKSIVTDAIWSAVFAANIHFSALQTDYFAADLPPSPLQHYWSLSVEEQFYLLWPVVVMLCVWLVRRRNSARNAVRAAAGRPTKTAKPRRLLIAAVVVITAASLLWSAHMTQVDPESAYFSPLTRAWELGLGALAALAIQPRQTDGPAARWRAQTLSLVGLFLIMCACLQFNDATPFPGTPALVPVLGSVFILVAGALWHGPTIVSRLLSIKPLRVLGDWSYSLYLWHFPVLVLPEIQLGRDLTWLERGGLLVLALALSAASYHLIEQPFQRPRIKRGWFPVALYPLSIALVIATGIGANSYATSAARIDGYQPAISLADGQSSSSASPSASGTSSSTASASASSGTATIDRQVRLVRASVTAARDDQPIPTTLEPAVTGLSDDTEDVGDCDYLAGSRQLCARGDATGSKTLVVLGDSHGRHWIPAMDKIAKRAGYRAYYLVMPQCVASMITPDKLNETEAFTDCDDFHAWAIAQIKKLRPDLLIISSRSVTTGIHDASGRHTAHGYVRKAEYAGYQEMLRDVMPYADRTAWIRDVPALRLDPATCLSSNARLGPCMTKPDPDLEEGADLQVKAARAAGAEVIDMDDYFCWQGECPAVVGSTITHRDFNHMTTTYAAELAKPLGTKLGLW
ncbi:MAG: acyltransferase family protein [Nocardioides sp.]|uniref:acyltransferase family protein n=1 Tax=Nocardioides sp. TaxID=35761 RepID=UPI0039E65486